MFDVPTILGCLALLLLLAAVASSARLLCGPAAGRLDRTLASNPAAERSTIFLSGSLVLSLLAAVYAVTRLFLP
jgi:hypothetical protein